MLLEGVKVKDDDQEEKKPVKENVHEARRKSTLLHQATQSQRDVKMETVKEEKEVKTEQGVKVEGGEDDDEMLV